MLYKIDDYSKVEKLFNGWPYPYITEVLDRKLTIYATSKENIKSAVIYLGHDAFFAGKPNKELLLKKQKGWLSLFGQTRKWDRLMKECYPDAFHYTRYAINLDATFDKEKLQSYIDALPEGYEIKKIDSKVYNLCKKLEDDDLEELIDWFDTKKEFLEYALGYAVIKDGKVVGGASTATRFQKGIEIEVDIDKKERRKGLASAACATLILDCLDRGWKPTWDAANPKSVGLAKKLGYTYSHKYTCYVINPIFHQMVKNPDKSKWESYCGKYETNCKAFKLKEVWMKDGDLYGKASNEVRRNFTFKFIPVADNIFGRRDGIVRVTFEEGYLVIDDIKCNKIN
ncbi:MAG: GNAT family N-acetyltransferase [Bacilli bacterium]|nr:GNAT family N-acetyltransferase [Bacilli bacterium]